MKNNYSINKLDDGRYFLKVFNEYSTIELTFSTYDQAVLWLRDNN